MGLCNATQSFQKMIVDILRDIPGVFVYLDDILVYAQTKAEHERVLKLNASATTFCHPSVSTFPDINKLLS